MKDMFDFAEAIADAHPQASWLEYTFPDGKWYGFAIKRGKGLELTVDIYGRTA